MTTTIHDLPSPGAYARAWRRLRAAPAGTRFRVPHGILWGAFGQAETRETLITEFRRALDNRINSRGGLIVRHDPDQDARWRRDQRAIADYRLRRIVRRGSGLETKQGRRAAPDVDAAFRRLDD